MTENLSGENEVARCSIAVPYAANGGFDDDSAEASLLSREGLPDNLTIEYVRTAISRAALANGIDLNNVVFAGYSGDSTPEEVDEDKLNDAQTGIHEQIQDDIATMEDESGQGVLTDDRKRHLLASIHAGKAMLEVGPPLVMPNYYFSTTGVMFAPVIDENNPLLFAHGATPKIGIYDLARLVALDPTVAQAESLLELEQKSASDVLQIAATADAIETAKLMEFDIHYQPLSAADLSPEDF